MSTIDDQIRARIQSFVTELSSLVREAAVESVRNAFGAESKPASHAKAPATHHTAKQATKHAALAPSKPTGGKRTPEQIKENVARVLAFIRINANTRTEIIRKKLNLGLPVVQDAIDRLKSAKKITMKGKKRGATYSAA